MEPTKQQQQARQVLSQLIDVKLIDDNPAYNCRGRISVSDVEPLAKDIAQNGLFQPIVVRPLVNGDFKYRVVAGYSRFMALRVLKWKDIPCVVRECDDEDAAFFNLSENLIRRDLNFMQEAESVRRIVAKFPHLNTEQVAIRLGQNRGWVDVRMYALQMPSEVQDVIARGFVTYDQIKLMWKMSDTDRLIAIRKIKEARERGQKISIKKEKKVFSFKEPRARSDMFAMITHIKDSLKTFNFGTRCLAWAAGEINDEELFGDIKNIADNEGIEYTIPKCLDKRTLEEKIRDGDLRK